jgi:hypothetical protein
MKRKIGFTGLKICPEGDQYQFKKGIAKVPGMGLSGKQATITFKQFCIEVNECKRRTVTDGIQQPHE